MKKKMNNLIQPPVYYSSGEISHPAFTSIPLAVACECQTTCGPQEASHSHIFVLEVQI